MHLQAAVAGLLGAANLVSAIYIPLNKISSEEAQKTAVNPGYVYGVPPSKPSDPCPVPPAAYPALTKVHVAPVPTVAPHVPVPPNHPFAGPMVAPNPAADPNACGELSKLFVASKAEFKAALAANKTGGAEFPPPLQVPPQQAFDCLSSIPLDAELSLEHLARMANYLKFQTTINDLKNPPKNSLQDPVDILGTLDQLAAQIKNGELTNHYMLEVAVSKMLLKCHDGHLGYGWLSNQLIAFRGPFSLVSLSTNGIEKPKVFVEKDIVEMGLNRSSHITQIDGFEVEAYLAGLADFGFSQSPDARYNELFANRDPGVAGTFQRLYGFYPGKNTLSVTYANASTFEYSYEALIGENDENITWDNITSGADFFKNVVVNPLFFGPPPPEPGLNDTFVPPVNGTPVEELPPLETPPLVQFGAPWMVHRAGPFVQDLNAIMGGFFLNDTLNTAVIDISSFSAADQNAPFQLEGVRAAVAEFLLECQNRHSQRLIIDVRGNGGGLIAMGFELYKQLFPAAPAQSFYRIRAHEGAQIFAEGVESIASDEAVLRASEELKTVGDGQLSPESDLVLGAIFSGFSRQTVLDVQGQKPKDLKTFMGPYIVNNDTTSLVVEDNWDLDVIGVDITGFGKLKNLTEMPQVFPKENIVLLSDGACASTCTIFSEMIKREQKDLSTIVMGGRPNDAPSPHIGGTHGSRVLDFNELLGNSQATFEFSPPKNAAEEERFIQNLPAPLPFGFQFAVINFRDAIRPEDPTMTPLQFSQEPADCRLYYDPVTFEDSIALWEQVSELKWGNSSKFPGCAVGGLVKGQESEGVVPDDAAVVDFDTKVQQGTPIVH